MELKSLNNLLIELGLSRSTFYNLKRWHQDSFPLPHRVEKRFHQYDFDEVRSYILRVAPELLSEEGRND